VASEAGLDRARPLKRSFYHPDALVVGPNLLNKLVVMPDGRSGRIIEVEAYRGAEDPASHAYRGPTARNRTMFGPPGYLYVYFSYGVHWCANVVCGPPGRAQAVLLRALDPVAGLELMRAARWTSQRHRSDRDLCRGPGRLCQALGIDRSLDGADLVPPPGRSRRNAASIWLADDGTPPPERPLVTTRVGISVAAELPWRFMVDGHRGVSRPAAPSDRQRLNDGAPGASRSKRAAGAGSPKAFSPHLPGHPVT
jgi:DNA-3-methyladenine glycosylase